MALTAPTRQLFYFHVVPLEVGEVPSISFCDILWTQVHCLLETVKMRPLWLVATFGQVCGGVVCGLEQVMRKPACPLLQQSTLMLWLLTIRNNVKIKLCKIQKICFLILRVYSVSSTFCSGSTE